MISPEDYQAIVCLLGEAQSALLAVLDGVAAASQQLAASNASFARQAPLGAALGSLRNTLDVQNGQQGWLQLLGAIQQHVVDGYGSLDDFLTDHAIFVPAVVAAASAKIGYAVPPSRVGSGGC